MSVSPSSGDETRRLHDLRRDYAHDALDRSDLLADPIAQFGRWFEAASSCGIIEPNAMTLATVGGDGQPDARIVLLKEVRPEGFVFYTNYDSAKGRQLTRNGAATLVFFWDRLERQVRIRGEAARIPGAESDAYFAGRPIKSRIAAAASPQSRRIASRRELEALFAQAARVSNEPDAIARPPGWGGFIVKPHTLEFWQGRRSRLHDRLRYVRSDNGWQIERLAP